jgi:Flp pilus assembly protein TadD
MRSIVLMAAVILYTGQAGAMGTEDPGATGSAPKSQAYAEAVRLIETQDYTGAIALLEGILALAPEDADAWSRLGYSRRKLGAYGPAQDAYAQALRLQPEHLGANEYLGELYIETGRLELARQRLAVLERACARSCEEYAELREQIEAAEAGGAN